MGSSEIRASLASVREHLTTHPEDRVGTDSYAVATLADGLATAVLGPAGQVRTDMPKPVGGGASAPTPGWYLRAGVASCTASVIALRAAELGIRLDHLEVRVDSRSDEAGMLGLDDKAHAGPIEASMTVHIRAGHVDPATLGEIVRWGIAHSSMVDALTRAVPLKTETRVG